MELTPSEKRVYFAIVNTGGSNKEIAKMLNISPLTVNTHIMCIFQKLGVDNQKQLIIQHYKNLLHPYKNTWDYYNNED